jgi:hypothetical protein
MRSHSCFKRGAMGPGSAGKTYPLSSSGMPRLAGRCRPASVLTSVLSDSEGKQPYSINTPLTASNFKIRASPAFQKTPINTVDVYVFYFQFTFNFPSWTSRVRSPSPALSFQSLTITSFPCSPNAAQRHGNASGIRWHSGVGADSASPFEFFEFLGFDCSGEWRRKSNPKPSFLWNLTSAGRP